MEMITKHFHANYMFVRVDNLRTIRHRMFGGAYYKEYGKAYVLVSCEDYNNYISKKETLHTFGATFAIIGEKPQFVWGDINFGQNYKVMEREREESLLETMAEHNLKICEKFKNRVAFIDAERMKFSISGKLYTADEARNYTLEQGQAFLYFHDNGYSFIGTDPAKSPQDFVNTAIAHVRNRGFFEPASSVNGFTFKEDFTCMVRIGKNEHWSEVSNT